MWRLRTRRVPCAALAATGRDGLPSRGLGEVLLSNQSVNGSSQLVSVSACSNRQERLSQEHQPREICFATLHDV